VQRYEELCRSRLDTGSAQAASPTIEDVIAHALEGEPEAVESLREKAVYLGAESCRLSTP